MAEHLDVTEEFLKDALDAYLLKYGKCTVVDNYMVFFEPLGVVPNEVDLAMLKEVEENSDCHEFISQEEAMKELGL